MAGNAFSGSDRNRVDKAIAAAAAQTGLTFSVCVGGAEGEPRTYARTLLTALSATDPEQVGGRVLLFVDPDGRQLEIVTSPLARRRLDDRACALATLSMTTTFGVGDLVGGLVNGLRMLADATESA